MNLRGQQANWEHIIGDSLAKSIGMNKDVLQRLQQLCMLSPCTAWRDNFGKSRSRVFS